MIGDKQHFAEGRSQKLVGRGDVELLVRLHEKHPLVLRPNQHGHVLRAELDGEYAAVLFVTAPQQRSAILAELGHVAQQGPGPGHHRGGR